LCIPQVFLLQVGQFAYQVVVDQDLAGVTPLPQDAGGCGQSGSSGLTLLERVDGGAQRLERAIAAVPEMFNLQAGIGRIYIARREWTKAITPLLAANRLDKTDADVMYDIGLAYKNMAQPKVAAEWLQQATTKKRDADTYYQLALLYLDANSGSAEGALREATHLAQEKETKQGVKVDWLTDAYYKLAQTEYGLHNLPGAKAAYESYIGRNPPPGAALDEARRLLSTELRSQ